MATKRKPKEITAGFVLSWVISIIFILAGIIGIGTEIVSSLLLILAGLVIFPPFDKYVKENYNFYFSSGLKVMLVIVLWILASFLRLMLLPQIP
jgi:uncharacterized protein YqgC (DUF456 family)